MSEDRKPSEGDRVRVTYEAIWDQDRGSHYWLRDEADGTTASIPASATVEVLETADDPSMHPVGTILGRGPWDEVAVRVGGQWVAVDDAPEGVSFFEHRHMTKALGWEVIGSVPGTPAAEQQQDETPLPEWEMELLEQETARQRGPRPGPRVPRTLKPAREPRVFSSDGPEPPADVTCLRYLDDSYADVRLPFLRRTEVGWVWATATSTIVVRDGNDWATAVRPGRYEEVQP